MIAVQGGAHHRRAWEEGESGGDLRRLICKNLCWVVKTDAQKTIFRDKSLHMNPGCMPWILLYGQIRDQLTMLLFVWVVLLNQRLLKYYLRFMLKGPFIKQKKMSWNMTSGLNQ